MWSDAHRRIAGNAAQGALDEATRDRKRAIGQLEAVAQAALVEAATADVAIGVALNEDRLIGHVLEQPTGPGVGV